MTQPTEPIAAEPRVKDMAREWWRKICDPRSGDPGARAQLRRCRATNDVLSIRAGVLLPKMTGDMPRDSDRFGPRFGRALDLARVLAHVTEDSGLHPMRELGWPVFPGSRREGDVERGPKLSESRFRRLLQTEDGEDLVVQFTRLIALMGGHANVAAVSEAFRWWDHPEGRTKQHWAFQYFNAAAAMRTANDSTESTEEPGA
jgi:CRISPR type I-E-associated protein CasB/Cse2